MSQSYTCSGGVGLRSRPLLLPVLFVLLLAAWLPAVSQEAPQTFGGLEEPAEVLVLPVLRLLLLFLLLLVEASVLGRFGSVAVSVSICLQQHCWV